MTHASSSSTAVAEAAAANQNILSTRATLSMDLLKATHHYVELMLDAVSGMKVLLLDKETTGMVSMAYTQSDILERDVFLFDRIDVKEREVMMHLKAVVFVRPTDENIERLADELRSPKYSEYYLFFSNVISVNHLQALAKADEHESVCQVKEYYCDYFTIHRDLFTLNIPSCISLEPSVHQQLLNRICDGVASVLLSLKKNPIIRYQKNSELSQRVSQELARRMVEERSLFVHRRSDVQAPVLLIIDRRNDPVTPLLSQWTYQAIVHELIGVKNNRVHLKSSSRELNEVVLSPENDEFYAENMYLNWGELGVNIKNLMQKVQTVDKSNRNISSIADMKRFIENFPQFKKLKGNVSKHIAVLDELSRLVQSRKLIDVSALEQELACKNDHSEALDEVSEKIANPQVRVAEKIRLVMLYALRYERDSSNETKNLLSKLEQQGIPRDTLSLIPALLRYAGFDQRCGDLFENTDWMSRFASKLKSGLKGVENIFTQHNPLLHNLLEELFKGRLSEQNYPAIGGNSTANQKPREVIVFFVGGTTYEEARTVAKINREHPGVTVILGGSTVHNSKSFLKDVEKIRAIAKKY
mmetsp:Transcript_14787/g.22098  ORF Transcript_14787/g.22098 Transcript_14787/m.22098 type:complete len:586 (+) Transcript_14787:26-1783(+)